MKQFNVIVERNGKFVPYDIISILISEYKSTIKSKFKKTPKSKEEFREFVKGFSKYMWWARCEYEIMLSDWPSEVHTEKWDVHRQVEMNLDVITDILIDSVMSNKKSRKEIKEGD